MQVGHWCVWVRAESTHLLLSCGHWSLLRVASNVLLTGSLDFYTWRQATLRDACCLGLHNSPRDFPDRWRHPLTSPVGAAFIDRRDRALSIYDRASLWLCRAVHTRGRLCCEMTGVRRWGAIQRLCGPPLWALRGPEEISDGIFDSSVLDSLHLLHNTSFNENKCQKWAWRAALIVKRVRRLAGLCYFIAQCDALQGLLCNTRHRNTGFKAVCPLDNDKLGIREFENCNREIGNRESSSTEYLLIEFKRPSVSLSYCIMRHVTCRLLARLWGSQSLFIHMPVFSPTTLKGREREEKQTWGPLVNFNSLSLSLRWDCLLWVELYNLGVVLALIWKLVLNDCNSFISSSISRHRVSKILLNE